MSPLRSVSLPYVATGIIVTRCQLQRPLFFLKEFQTLVFAQHSGAFHQQFGMNMESTTQAFWRDFLAGHSPGVGDSTGLHGSLDGEDITVGSGTILESSRSFSHLPAFPIQKCSINPDVMFAHEGCGGNSRISPSFWVGSHPGN